MYKRALVGYEGADHFDDLRKLYRRQGHLADAERTFVADPMPEESSVIGHVFFTPRSEGKAYLA